MQRPPITTSTSSQILRYMSPPPLPPPLTLSEIKNRVIRQSEAQNIRSQVEIRRLLRAEIRAEIRIGELALGDFKDRPQTEFLNLIIAKHEQLIGELREGLRVAERDESAISFFEREYPFAGLNAGLNTGLNTEGVIHDLVMRGGPAQGQGRSPNRQSYIIVYFARNIFDGLIMTDRVTLAFSSQDEADAFIQFADLFGVTELQVSKGGLRLHGGKTMSNEGEGGRLAYDYNVVVPLRDFCMTLRTPQKNMSIGMVALSSEQAEQLRSSNHGQICGCSSRGKLQGR